MEKDVVQLAMIRLGRMGAKMVRRLCGFGTTGGIKQQGTHRMKTFGASAPLKELQRKFGFEPERVTEIAKELLGKGKRS